MYDTMIIELSNMQKQTKSEELATGKADEIRANILHRHRSFVVAHSPWRN